MTTKTLSERLPEKAGDSPKTEPAGSQSSRSLRLLTLSCALAVVLLGVAVILGWFTQNEHLMTVLPGFVRMKSNTAVGFLASGLGLLCLLSPGRGTRYASRLFSLGVLVLGCLTLLEYLYGFNFGIDQLLFVDHVQVIYPGRMAPTSATSFVFAATALLLLTGNRMARILAQFIAHLLAAISFVAIVGYLYGVQIFYGSSGYTSMALHTGVGFLILSAGLILKQPDSIVLGVLLAPERGGWLARRILPAMMLLPVLLGWLFLHPAINFGRPSFGMGLLAVTMAGTGTTALWFLALFLNREERQRAEIIQIREQSASTIRQSERELRLITDHLPTLLSYISLDGRFLRVNRIYEEWLGLEATEIVGRSVHELLGNLYWERSASAREAVLGGRTVTFETDYPTVHGERLTRVTYAPDLDEQCQVRGIVCMVLDIDERRRAEQAVRKTERLEQANRDLQELALTDQLTGLRNRRAFDERLRSDMDAVIRGGLSLSLLMLDVDNFKVRNDTWGHAEGDAVLRRLGAILASAIRAPYIAARYGGEEFAVLLPGSDQRLARLVADRIQRMVAEQLWNHTQVTLSIGIATTSNFTHNPQELIQAADGALYRAKREGKNRIVPALSTEVFLSPPPVQ
ncbi:PAS domain S-box-containing protein/diguanylate cyclase (GGDEF) domain-containing protein [Granulicella pectinivorans]|uniref:diguanylate cyclase n=1 Tax=Granulicella pectinivorans TaxID=474950 RepID=A0A1I6MY31_9BACT|nr:GGDEF domain-containing protein [Granulicella pectinivorans]SFS20610.1 PAS domain S-box-containing protein/diguanylate cyclase (GGDEF) domain-containing protein [Granulicella pectinivorans]